MTSAGPAGADSLVLRFGGSLVEQLGAQLYPSVTATVAELISNAWDANAQNVWIKLPFGEWSPDDAIEVLDDGHGMTRTQAQETYLIVGRKRRAFGAGSRSEGGLRLVHGRKGIGKLAAFGTAGILDCSSVRDGTRTDFRLNYDNIRKLDPSADYKVEEVPTKLPLVTPAGHELHHGTRVLLTNLKLKRAIPRDQFLRSMSRRFALDGQQMKIHINEVDELHRFDIPCEFKFPRDGLPPGDSIIETLDGWAEESVIDGEGQPRKLRWWIGFTEKPLTEDIHQGISVVANGKMAQRPFKFERSQGTEGQLGQEYLVGEVEADWIDEGIDIEDDLIQSNRDQLQLEDKRLEFFVLWGRKRLAWALRERSRLKREKALNKFEANERIKEMIKPFTKTEQKRLLKVAETVSRIPEITEEGISDTIASVVNAQSEKAVRELMDTIEEREDAFQDQMWQLVHEFGLIDARRILSIVEARLATIRKLKEAINEGAREVPNIHNIVVSDPWLLDPRWNILADEIDITTLGIDYKPEVDETGLRIDFLFALAPHAPAPMDEVIVVEIKRGTNRDLSVRKVTADELNKFHLYVLGVRDHYQASTDHPAVRGLMIAQGYTGQADRLRKSLEQNTDVRLAFRTWDRAIDETERMHIAWLDLSRDRANM
jgi:Histidine kinase-, DNA gyrase B-, and HSP90-like ATPase